MLNRRQLRIKVLQALYAYFQSEEENYRGTVDEAIAHFTAKQVKGEIVIVLGGKSE